MAPPWSLYGGIIAFFPNPFFPILDMKRQFHHIGSNERLEEGKVQGLSRKRKVTQAYPRRGHLCKLLPDRSRRGEPLPQTVQFFFPDL